MAAKSMNIRYGDNESISMSAHEPYLVSVGAMEMGETVTLEVTAEQYCSGNFYVVTLNEEAYNKGMEILANEQWEIDYMSNSRITGKVDASFAGVMMTSIPYDAGWTVRVDGEKVPTFGINDGLLAFHMGEGVHTVELTYHPTGWWIGVAVSALSLAVLVALLIVGRCRNVKKTRKGRPMSQEDTLPVQGAFAVTEEPKTDVPPLPSTFAELAGEVPAEDSTDE